MNIQADSKVDESTIVLEAYNLIKSNDYKNLSEYLEKYRNIIKKHIGIIFINYNNEIGIEIIELLNHMYNKLFIKLVPLYLGISYDIKNLSDPAIEQSVISNNNIKILCLHYENMDDQEFVFPIAIIKRLVSHGDSCISKRNKLNPKLKRQNAMITGTQLVKSDLLIYIKYYDMIFLTNHTYYYIEEYKSRYNTVMLILLEYIPKELILIMISYLDKDNCYNIIPNLKNNLTYKISMNVKCPEPCDYFKKSKKKVNKTNVLQDKD